MSPAAATTKPNLLKWVSVFGALWCVIADMVGHSESEGAAVSKLPYKQPWAAIASKVEAEFLFATEWTKEIKMISWLWLG